MSDDDMHIVDPSDDAPPKVSYIVDYDRRGMASCKKCKQKLLKGQVRIGKAVPNPFSDKPEDTMKMWYHAQCIFDTLRRARATTKKIESTEDLEGFDSLKEDDQKLIEQHLNTFLGSQGKQKNSKAAAVTPKTLPASPWKVSSPSKTPTKQAAASSSAAGANSSKLEEELSFRAFRKLCAEIADEASYTGKTRIVRDFLQRGLTGAGFQGDRRVLFGLLLPQEVAAVYNLKDKQLAKLFATLFGVDQDTMLADVTANGDVSETVRKFFEASTSGIRPAALSTLSQLAVSDWLTALTHLSKADDQRAHLAKIARSSTANDLKMIVRLIKKDIRINAGAKHILDALDESAYNAYCALQDLDAVLAKFAPAKPTGASANVHSSPSKVAIGSELMKPVSPMLAAQCRSAAEALQRSPEGLFSEIKYDGERLQLHKRAGTFRFFSRNLKPVQPHKVAEIQPVIAKAFPGVNEIILDSEVLVVDTRTGRPLPFGTLGIHKKNAAGADACNCLFVFDILHLDGVDLKQKPLTERKRILKETMKEVKNRVMIGEYELVTKREQLEAQLVRVFKENLEGLVLKDVNGQYEPGKRHWLKMKRDYLGEGSMADTADLIVLGAYSGTGQKGGLMSIFLMGAYDPKTSKFCTVSRVANGLDMKTLHDLQSQLKMVPIQKDPKRVPSWLNVARSVIPEFVVKDPKASPVWEITGAEFTKSPTHTAAGISIRFPRITRIRDDKSWRDATDVPRLVELFEASKQASDVRLEQLVKASSATSLTSSPRRRKLIKVTGTPSSAASSASASANTTPKKHSDSSRPASASPVPARSKATVAVATVEDGPPEELATPTSSPRPKRSPPALRRQLSTPENNHTPVMLTVRKQTSSPAALKQELDPAPKRTMATRSNTSPVKRSSSPPTTVPKRATRKPKATNRDRFIADDDSVEELDAESEEQEAIEIESESDDDNDNWRAKESDDDNDDEREQAGTKRKRKPWLTAPDRAPTPDSSSPTNAKRARTMTPNSASASPSQKTVVPKAKTKLIDSLPDVFSGLRFDLSQVQFDSEANRQQLEKHIVAYDGELCSAKDVATATHIVLPAPSTDLKRSLSRTAKQSPSAAQTVTLKWLIDCIRQKRLIKAE